MEAGKDYQENKVELKQSDALKVVYDAAQILGGHRPTALLTLALVFGYGIDQFGLEFVKWPDDKLQAWLERVVYKISKLAVEEGIEMEREGLAGSLATAINPSEINGGLRGKVIDGV